MQGLDFSLRLAKTNNIIIGTFIISTTSMWTTVSINYAITARDDFRVGLFIPDLSDILPCNSNTISTISTVISYKLIKPWSSTKKTIFVIPFLSGIKTSDREINIKFKKPSFDSITSLMQIPLSVDKLNSTIELIMISYFVIAVDSGFQLEPINDLSAIPSDVNTFVGVAAVKTASSSVSSSLISSSSSPNTAN